MPKPGSANITLIPHTADIGIEVVAGSIDELFAAAARGFTKILITNPSAVRPRVKRQVNLEGTDLTDLMVRWLSELLYLFEVHRLVFRRFAVTVEPSRVTLQANLLGEEYDPVRHHAAREIKAVTYHDATVEPMEQGWHCRIIFDI